MNAPISDVTSSLSIFPLGDTLLTLHAATHIREYAIAKAKEENVIMEVPLGNLEEEIEKCGNERSHIKAWLYHISVLFSIAGIDLYFMLSSYVSSNLLNIK